MADPVSWYLAFTILSTAYSVHQQNKARKRAAASADAAKGYQISVEGSALPIPIVMGRSLVGGIRVFHDVSNNYVFAPTAGAGNSFLAGVNPSTTANFTSYDPGTGEVTVTEVVTPSYASLGKNYSHDAPNFLFVDHVIGAAPMSPMFHALVDTKPFNHSDFTNAIRFWVSPNGDGATPNPMTVAAGMPRSQARFPNVAAVGAVYYLDRNEPQFSGNIPEAQFFTAGWLCYDVDAANNLITTRTATTNPVRQLLTYLLDTTFGRGLDVALIDLPSFRAGIVLCNRVVQVGVAVSGAYWSNLGVTTRDLPLFESCLTLDTSKPYRENIQEILDTMIGSDLIWSENRYKFKLQVPRSFAEIQFARPTLTANDILRESVSIKLPDASSRKNFCTVKFRNEHLDFQDDTVSWPPKGGAVHTAYMVEDGQIPLEQEISLSGITNPYHALARAEEFVRASRISTAYVFKTFMDGAQFEPGDIQQIEAPEVGIPADVVRILEVKSDSDNTCEITCVKFQWESLAWNAKDDEIVPLRAYSSSLLSRVATIDYTAGASTLGYTTGSLSWTVDNSGHTPDQYIVFVASSAYVVGTVPQWQELGRAGGGMQLFELPPMQSGNYVFGVAPARGGSMGQITTSSLYALVAPNLDPADTTPPPKPGAFTAVAKLGNISVTLPAAPDYTQGHGHGYTEILLSVPPAAGAVKGSFQSISGEAPATSGLGIVYRVWLRYVSKDGVAGPLSDSTDINVGQIVSGEILDGAISRTKFASGIEPVDIIPGSTLPTVKSTTLVAMNGKLYRWNGTAYVSNIDPADIPNGAISVAKMAAGIQPVTVVTGTLVPTVKSTEVITVNGSLYRWNGTAYTKSIAVEDIPSGTLSADKFANGIQPVTVVTGTLVPTVKSTEVITVNGSLYRWNGTAYTAEVQAVNVIGKITDNQVNLAIGGANLVLDSSFEFLSNSPWVFHSGASSVASSAAAYGGRVMQTVMASDADLFTTQNVDLRPNTTYRLSAWRKIVSGTAVASGSRTLGIITNESNIIGTSLVFAAGGWVRFDVVYTTAATVTSATIRFYGVVGTTHWDGVQLEEGATLTHYAPNPSEIMPGQVTGLHLAADSVTADKIVAGAVVAGKIAANAITASTIASGSIQANHLLITADSICPDPTFRDINFWSGTGLDPIGWYVSTDNANMGAVRCALLFSGAAWGSPLTNRKHMWSAAVPLSAAGESYRLRFRANNASNQAVFVVARLHSATGAELGEIAVVVPANSGISGYSVLGVPSAAAVAVKFIIYNQGGTTFSGACYITDVNLEQAVSGNLLVDGAVTAEKVAANAITAAKIAAGAITADKMSANSVTAGSIAAGAVSTDKLSANSVTAAKIATGAIEADKIATNAVTAGKIAAGAVSADAIQANAITARHLMIGDFTNLILNPDGSLDASGAYSSGWQDSTGGYRPISNSPVNWWGVNSASSSTLTFVSRDNRYGSEFAVKPGDEFFGSMLCQPSGGVVPLAQIQLVLIVKDSTGAVIDIPAMAIRAVGGVGGPLEVSGSVKMGANAARAQIMVWLPDNNGAAPYGLSQTGYAWHATNINVRRKSAGNLIVDGSITASKIFITGSGDAINADPMFVDKTAWEMTGGGTSFGSGTTLAGLNGSSFVYNAAGGSDDRIQTRRFPIDPKKIYSLTANVTAGAGNNRKMFIYIRMYTAAGVELTGADTGWGGSFAGYVFGGVPTPNVWTKVGSQFGTAAMPIPTNAVFAKVGVWFQYSGDGTSLTEQACQNLRLVEAVAGSLIVDGAISAGKLAADSVEAGKIAAGAVNAREIAAGAIRTSHLLVTADSICPDPTFRDMAFWSGTLLDPNGWVSVADHANIGASRCALLWAGGTNNIGVNRRHIWSSKIPISAAGESYRLRARFNNGSNQVIRAIARFTNISNAVVYDLELNCPAASTLNLSALSPPLANATNVELIIHNVNGTEFAGACYVTDVNLEQATSGNMIVDGSVTANKISVGSLSAITANVGLLRTAVSGARVELESNQIRVYDGNNLLRVKIGVF